METNERNPLKWPGLFCSAILRIVAAYVRKWSGNDSPDSLSPEAREEIVSRIVFDIMTSGLVPDGISALHYVFRVCRKWRVRGWAGDIETDRQRKRNERAKARKSLRDPGSAESEEARNKSPFRGCSDDARQPRPDRILEAIEEAEARGLAYVSARQAKARRKPNKANQRPPRRYRAIPTGHRGRPRAGFSPTGRPLYFPGAATLIRWEPIPETEPAGEYDRKTRTYRPYVSHRGTIANRAIGKRRTPATGRDAVGHAMAVMAVLGRTPRRKFIPATPPTAGIPGERTHTGRSYDFRHGVRELAAGEPIRD